MALIRRFGIRPRLAVMVLLPVAGMVALATMALWSMSLVGVGGPAQTSLADDAELTADILPPPLFVVEPYAAAHELTMAAPARARELAKQITELEEAFQPRVDHWRSRLAPGAVRTAVLDEVAASAREFLRVVRDELVPLVLAQQQDRARELMAGRIVPLYQAHRDQVLKAVGLIESASAATRQQAHALVGSVTWWMIGVTGVVMALSLGVGWAIMTGIARPVARIAAIMQNIAAGSGDLRQRMPEDDDASELGTLARAFNAFVHRLNGIVVHIGQSSREVCTHAQEIAAASEQSGRSVELQAKSLGEITGEVDRLVAETQRIADQAERASATAASTRQTAHEGSGRVEATIEGMRAIEQTVGAGAAAVTELGRQSEQIGRIIQVIRDIADQTNLLALNAAIEAARAAEHGRGFAVVADEVRKLAERTTDATRQVAQSIKCIQDQTRSAVERMDEGRRRVVEGVARAGEAHAALGAIVQRVEATTTLIGDISGAVRVNHQIGEGINQRVRAINVGAEELGRAALDSSKATSALQVRSAALLDVVARFETDHRAGARKVFDRPVDCNLGKVLDLSPTGAKVQLAPGRQLETGQQVGLSYHLHGREHQHTAAVARRTDKDGATTVGLRFEPPESRA